MELPENKKLIRVIYEYEDESYELTDNYLKNFLDNIEDAGVLALTGRVVFKEVQWTKRSNKKNK